MRRILHRIPALPPLRRRLRVVLGGALLSLCAGALGQQMPAVELAEREEADAPGAGRLQVALKAGLTPASKVHLLDPLGAEEHREVELPARASASHAPVTAKTSQASYSTSASDDSCPLVDVACEDVADCVRNSVVQLTFTLEDGATNSCTGTVLNSSREAEENFARPYVLTSARCVSTQEVADSVVTDWYYQSASCDADTVVSERTTLRGGAELLAHDAATDMALLELREAAPPGGFCLLGWNAEASLQVGDSPMISVHHPGGAPKKFAEGAFRGYWGFESPIGAMAVERSRGSMSASSRGAGLLAPTDSGWLLVGTFIEGVDEEACPAMSLFGRFDVFFQNVGYRFLDPALHGSDDHGGARASATGIRLGSSVAARIDRRDDADMFRLEVTEPGILVLSTTGDVDVFALLLDEDGRAIEESDDGGFLTNARVSLTVTPGTYYARIAGLYPWEVGAYTLHTAFTPESEVPAAEIPLFLADGHALGQGFVRVFNSSAEEGTVEIRAFDDQGNRAGPVSLSLGARETRHFNSHDLENGNPDKGLQGRTGSGEGNWWLRLHSDVALEVGAFVRTSDGFLTAMHDEVHLYELTGQHFVPVFNPGSNRRQLSLLRLVNPDPTRAVAVRITGEDDAGARPEGVRLVLPAGTSRTVDATELEQGGEGIEGRLGDGTGKWKLRVEAEGDIRVMSLLQSVSGHLTNLSSPGHIID